MIVDSNEPLTLVGGAPLAPGDLDSAVSLAPLVVAADSGAVPLLDAGLQPVAVIGDMDSLPANAAARIPPDRLHPIPEQESTDFDKALRSIRAPAVLALGFTGGRVDHQLAAIDTLFARAWQPCILLGRHEVICHCPPRFALPCAAGDIVSLVPLVEMRGRSRGLEWPIDGLDLAPGRRIGTSNRAKGPIEIAPEKPGLIAILPRARLRDVMQALVSLPADARWPAP